MMKEKILSLLSTFGISGPKAAEIIGCSYGVFRQKKLGINGNYFSEKNYCDLVYYIKEKAKKL